MDDAVGQWTLVDGVGQAVCLRVEHGGWRVGIAHLWRVVAYVVVRGGFGIDDEAGAVEDLVAALLGSTR